MLRRPRAVTTIPAAMAATCLLASGTAVASSSVQLQGRLGQRYAANDDYLIALHDRSIPAIDFDMLRPFRERGVDQEKPWDGEYAGKWMDAAALAVAGGADPALATRLDAFAAALRATQRPDGYVGIDAEPGGGWDLWNTWYVLYGMLTHHERQASAESLACAVDAGGYVVDRYLPPDAEYDIFASPWGGGCSVDILDQLVRLHEETDDPGLLELTDHIAQSFPPIVEMRASGQVHISHAYVVMSYLGGLVEYDVARDAEDNLAWLDTVWRDIAARHRFPTGSVGQWEQFLEPVHYKLHASKQETCATVEWLIGLRRMYEATGDPWYVDQMEAAIYNALLAAQSVDGMKWMYHTVMNGGTKEWFSGPTKCCYWSGPRAIASLPELLYRVDADGLRVDLYEASVSTGIDVLGHPVGLTVETAYPAEGRVTLTLALDGPATFALKLRLPAWAEGLALTVNGEDAGVALDPGTHAAVIRTWNDGDRVVLDLALPATLVGNEWMTGIDGAAIRRGAEVMSIDRRDNPGINFDDVELYSDAMLRPVAPVDGRRRYRAEALVDGEPSVVFLTPYADAGNEGANYATVFPVNSAPTPGPGDLNIDQVVDFTDLLLLLSAWGPCPACRADLDGNGAVDFGDVLALLSHWGPVGP